MSNFAFLFNRPVQRKIADDKLHTVTAINGRIKELNAEPITAIGQARIKKLQNRLAVEFKDPQTIVIEAIARIPMHLLVGKKEKEEGDHAY